MGKATSPTVLTAVGGRTAAPVAVDDVVVISVVIVDDHPLMATTLAHALATKPDIEVLEVADSCAAALAAVAQHRPDVLLLDQRLPDGLGTDALPALLAECPKMKVVLVTAVDSDDVAVTAIERGAAGVIPKGRRFDTLVQAVRAAAQDEAVITPDVLRRLLPRLADGRTVPGGDLTSREREVLKLLVEGLTTEAVADALGLALGTTRAHVRSVIVKLGAHTRLEAVAIALRENLAVAP